MTSELENKIEEANARALDIIINGQPTWKDVKPAGEHIKTLQENMVLHAGPPMEPQNASQPFRTAVSGAAVHEGLAKTPEEAWKMVEAREIILGSQLDHGGASGAVNCVTRSTPIMIVENSEQGTTGFCTFHEGPSKSLLRWGVYNQEVEDRLTFFGDVLGPALSQAVRSIDGINLRNIAARAEAMGDENHSRQLASTALLYEQLMPAIMDIDIDHATRKQVVNFLCTGERFFLHAFIAGAVSVLAGVKGMEYCTLMVHQGGNGYEFGTKFAFSGDDWYTASCPICTGPYLNPEWDASVAVGYLGDSCCVETYGFGGNSAAAGPMVVHLTGGDFQDALDRTASAREICIGSLDWAPIPCLNFQGPPVGFDLRKVVATGITPVCHGGMHHIKGGQAGAGYMNVPLECFVQALEKFAEKYNVM
ncbi:MAG: DUF1116 domain-containing protein [Candidatus Sumerlaeia bacterium]